MESYDDLNLGSEKSIQKQLEVGEIILFSSMVYKFNEVSKRQERTLMITNKNIVNLSKHTIKRKIPIKKVYGITVSNLCGEFVIHVPEEYDYRYLSIERKEQAVLSILTALKTSVPVFFKNDLNLNPFTTTKIDKKKNISRLPIEGYVMMNDEGYRKKMKANEIENSQIKARTSTLYSKKQGELVTISDFNLIKVLGRGAFGKVMLVEKKSDKQLYAIKSIRKEDISDPETLAHTKTEREVLEHVNHPFLVHLINAFQTPEKIFFVTEFMKGGELFQHLRAVKRFDENRARFYTAEISLALDHLHSKNIIYRDLKPENVLMDENGHVCLTDFGMAKILKKNELALTFCGTPEYFAPEILQEVGHSMAADWWALGIFTYEMLYALPAFHNKNQQLMFKKIQESNVVFPSLPEVSNEAKDFITKLLIKDPKKRLGSLNGAKDIQSHPWFKSVDWDQLIKKQVTPPFKPKIEGDQWLGNFDKQFTEEDAINSYAPELNIDQDEFKTFDDFQQK